MLLSPSTIGLPIAADTAQTNNIVSHTLVLFLCLAYSIGLLTAIYLESKVYARFLIIFWRISKLLIGQFWLIFLKFTLLTSTIVFISSAIRLVFIFNVIQILIFCHLTIFIPVQNIYDVFMNISSQDMIGFSWYFPYGKGSSSFDFYEL